MSLHKRRLIVHIGQHKTGSKALQSFLAHNPRELRAQGILYPTTTDPDLGIRAYAISQFRLYALLRHEAIGECFGGDAAATYWNQHGRFCAPFDSARAFFDSFDAEARRAGLDQVVVSAEDLFDMHTAHELAFTPELIDAGARRLAALATDFGYNVRIVVYVRRQDHLLGAHYVQFLKGSADQDLDFEAFARAFAPRLDARSILARWAAVFGSERILVRPYERISLPGGIVPDFFARALGIDVPARCIAPPADVESLNRTLERDFVEFIRVLNRRGAGGQSVFAREAVLDAALNSPSEGATGISAWLSPSSRRDLLAAYHDGNSAIARDFLGSTEGRLFAEAWPEPDDGWTPYPGFSPERATAIALSVHETILARQVPVSVSLPLPMGKRSMARRLLSIPGGLLGAIGLILAVELIVGLLFPRPKTFAVAEYQVAAEALPDASKYEVLCLGDSMVKDGLLPRVIEARTGRLAYNFAISGGRPPVTYYMLRRLLGAGARPSALVVDFTPAVAAADFRDNLPGLAEFASLGDAFDLTWTARDPGVMVAMMLGRLVTTLRERFDRGAAGDPDQVAPFLRNLAENAGALVLPENPRSATMAEYWNERANLRSPWTCDPVNALYVERTLALAEAHKIPVFWLITPMHPRVQAGRERLGLDDSYSRFVRSIVARHPGTCVIDGRQSAYDSDLFIDATHLDHRGAFALSEEIAAILDRHPRIPEGTRWLELPAFRNRRVDVASEDLDQSRLAIKARDSAAIR